MAILQVPEQSASGLGEKASFKLTNVVGQDETLPATWPATFRPKTPCHHWFCAEKARKPSCRQLRTHRRPAGFLSEGFPKSRRGMGLVYHTRNLDKVEFQPPHCIAVVGVMATDHFIKLFFVMIKYPMTHLNHAGFFCVIWRAPPIHSTAGWGSRLGFDCYPALNHARPMRWLNS